MLSEIAAHCDPSSRGEPGVKNIAHRSNHHGDANMQSRTAKFVSAVCASFLAGMPLTTVSHSATPAADDCLSSPKGPAPEGSHWYYHIDRASKRHCWYLGDQREKLSRAKPQNMAPIADPASPQKEATAQRPVADAHAELPLPQAGAEQETSISPWQQIPPTSANAASIENGQAANAPDTKTQRSVIASRWPDPSGVNSSISPPPATASSAEAVQLSAEQAPLPAAASSTAADLSSEKQSGSVQMLLLVMMGALVLAGVMGSAIFRFGSLRQAARRQTRRDRRAIWDSVDTDRPWPPAYPKAEASTRRVDIPRELRQADDPNGRIAEIVTRLSKGAAA
jgi:hypothetical protein